MASKKHTAEEIIGKLRQAEVALAQGIAVPDVCRRLGVAEQTYYLPLAQGVRRSRQGPGEEA